MEPKHINIKSFTWKRRLTFCDFLLLLLFTHELCHSFLPVNAQHAVQFGGGIISGHTLLSHRQSPYYINSDVFVEKGSKLEIEAGTQLKIAARVGFTIRGTLIAKVLFYSLFFNY